jgi:hypothetical protein
MLKKLWLCIVYYIPLKESKCYENKKIVELKRKTRQVDINTHVRFVIAEGYV